MDFIKKLEIIVRLSLKDNQKFISKAQQILDVVECHLKIIENIKRSQNSNSTITSNVEKWKGGFIKNFYTFIKTTMKDFENKNVYQQNRTYLYFKERCDIFISEISIGSSILAEIEEEM